MFPFPCVQYLLGKSIGTILPANYTVSAGQCATQKHHISCSE